MSKPSIIEIPSFTFFDASAAVTADVVEPEVCPAEPVDVEKPTDQLQVTSCVAEPETELNPVAVDNESDQEDLSEEPADNSGNALVIIDSSVEGHEDLVAQQTNATVIVVDPDDSIHDIANELASLDRTFDTLEIYSHNQSLGSEDYSQDDISEDSNAWQSISEVLNEEGNILWFGCYGADDAQSQTTLNTLAELTGHTVYGSTDATGVGGDFILEYSTSNDDAVAMTSLAYTVEQQENADISLMFNSGGIINQWTHTNVLPNGDIELVIGRVIDSAGDAPVLWQDAENYSHAYSTTIGGEALNNWHLFDWRDRAEYQSMISSFTQTEWNRFNGGVFSGYDVSGNNNFRFNDDQGVRFGNQIGGGWESPDLTAGANYANWDTSDGQENFAERLPVIIGGLRDDGDPTFEEGQLHDVLDGVAYTGSSGPQSNHEPDAVFIQTRVILGRPELAMDNSANIITEAREDGTLADPVPFLTGMNVTVGSNMYVNSISIPLAGFNAAEHSITYNSSSVPASIQSQFNHTIVNGTITVTAASGEPGAAALDAYLDGFEFQFTTASQDQPHLLNLTGTATLTTMDIFGQSQTLVDSAAVNIAIYDRPDATPGLAGETVGSGHTEIPSTIDRAALETAVGNLDDAHGVAVEGDTQPVAFAQNFESQSRDDGFNYFDIVVDQPELLFMPDGSINPDIEFNTPSISGVDAQLVITSNTDAYWRLTSSDSTPLTNDEVNDYVQGQTARLIGEDSQAMRLTFSYEWEDAAGNYDQSIDGYLGAAPDGPDFGRTVLVTVPVNDAPVVIINPDPDSNSSQNSACVTVAIEGGEPVMPLSELTLTDIDSPDMQSAVVDFEPALPSSMEVTLSPESQSMAESLNLEVNLDGNGLTVSGVASTAEYQTVLSGLTFTNPDNNNNSTDTVDISMTITVTDVSASGFQDHLIATDATCFGSQSVAEPEVHKPEHLSPQTIHTSELAYRHIDEETILKRITQEEFDSLPVETHSHIHLLVNGMNRLLDAQTMDVSSMLVSQTADVQNLITAFNPELPASLAAQLESTNEVTQAKFIQRAAQTVSLGNA